MKKIRWGVLSTAKIAREKVIPALQKSALSEVTAIASRDIGLARSVAEKLSIPKAYDAYGGLLNDPEIDAVYIPLPNNLHVSWAIKSLEAGKHVLCEKPISISVAEAEQLLAAARQHPQLKIMEAFMYRFHPQWILAKKLVKEGGIGDIRTIQSFFSYYNTDPLNIRNQKAAGGGGLMDIGCYCISLSRYIFEVEPLQVMGSIDWDPMMGTDRVTSGMLRFPQGISTFTCSTQTTPYQRVNILGTKGRIEIEIPFNAPPDKPTRIWLHTPGNSEEASFEAVDQYTLQADAFCHSILNNTPVPTPLKDAVNNMRVIEAIFESAKEGLWVNCDF